MARLRLPLIVLLVVAVGAVAFLSTRGGTDDATPAGTLPLLSSPADRPVTQIGAPANLSTPSTMPTLRSCLKAQGFSAHKTDDTHVRVRSGDFGPIIVRLFPTVAEARANATPEMTAPITDPANPPAWILANNALVHGMVFIGFRSERLAFGACLTRAG